MTTYARIQDGVVVELLTTTGDIDAMFTPELVWVDTQGSPVALPGATYANGVFSARARALPTPEQMQAAVVQAVQSRLDVFARTRNYDGILSACTYATSTVAKFKAEGQCCVNARDAHWNACYSILADVQAGVRAMPTVDQVLSEMPPLAWPQ